MLALSLEPAQMFIEVAYHGARRGTFGGDASARAEPIQRDVSRHWPQADTDVGCKHPRWEGALLCPVPTDYQDGPH
jgi:hypothetical protein